MITIIEAIKKVLNNANKPLSADQIFELITTEKLYEFKAKYPKGVVKGQLRRHCLGIDFPSANPVKHFQLIGNNKYSIITANKSPTFHPLKEKINDSHLKIPEEIIDDAYKEYKLQIKQQLLDTILNSDPAFFEMLVIDLLLKMGYGENGTGVRKGKVGDGGIDGEIIQDRLGLDRIYIQAKRHTDAAIGRPIIQQFVGALENITKGVFITTSKFTPAALAYAQKQQQKTLVLIDGNKLTELMVDYSLGVTQVTKYVIYKVDLGYFSEG